MIANTNELKDSRPAPGCLCCRLGRFGAVLLVVAVASWAFIAGQATQTNTDRGVMCEEAQRQFREFLTVAIDLGIVTVDRRRLDELTCIVCEAQWEDADAAERQQSSSGEAVSIPARQ